MVDQRDEQQQNQNTSEVGQSRRRRPRPSRQQNPQGPMPQNQQGPMPQNQQGPMPQNQQGPNQGQQNAQGSNQQVPRQQNAQGPNQQVQNQQQGQRDGGGGGQRRWNNWNNNNRGGGTWRERRADNNSSARHHPQVNHQVNQGGAEFNKNFAENADGAAFAPVLVQDLQRKLARSDIECMICYDAVGRRSPIWSCSGCFSIFHLTCIRKWARNPISVDRTAAGVTPGLRGTGLENWRCPGCQAVQLTLAESLHYTCFCGQVVEPPVDMYLTPHSCGGTCQKPLDKTGLGHCQHLCTLQCHPGPCPSCVAFAPPETCGCGRTTVTRRCVERDGTITSCGEPCQRQLSCGRHGCSRPCHENECGPCNAVMMFRCFCGWKQEKLCCQTISVKGDIDRNIGVYSCESPCSKLLACGNHSCLEKCHPGTCGLCLLLPSKVTTCPCGKQALKDIPVERTSCIDPIPTCSQTCEKLMPCNKHKCNEVCHLGPCRPCQALEEQKCRCGSSSRIVPCHIATSSVAVQDEVAAFVCDKKCGKKKNCGRHRCNSTCCPSTEDEHFCMLECGKKLRCGQHTCQELCHAGHCPPCLQSAFTELSCACGKSSIPPPVPCGTPAPRCENSCSVPQPCGHSASHTCHFGPCPPCTVPVTKECVGKHMLMRNVPCGSKDIKCNLPCGKIRKCGRHACSKTCHSDACDSPENSRTLSCGQVCGVTRRECTHTCVAPCHPTSLCPDTRCNTAVEITCGCKRLTAKVPCDTGGGSRDQLSEARILSTLPTPLQPIDDTTIKETRVPLSRRKLSCNDECAKAEKLKALADALGIAAAPDGGLAAEGISELVQEMLRRDCQFISDVEDRFKYLICGPRTIAGAGGTRAHAFCQLPKDKREVIHQLAQRWFLSVSNVGWDLKRFMVVHVTAKSKAPASRLTKPNLIQQPRFNPSLDVDPRLAVALFNLPREADMSSLALRFGGDCELIWLNDRNALAIFGDAMRAATAMRRVDHASAYHGAFVMGTATPAAILASWGSPSVPRNNNRISSQRTSDPAWVEDNWVDEVKGAWQPKTSSVGVSNPWNTLGSEPGESSSNNNSITNSATGDTEVDDDWEAALDAKSNEK